MPLITTDLILWLERHFAESFLLTNDSPVQEFGETVAIKSVDGRPRNKVLCFSESDLDQFDDILTFYSTDHLTPTFYLSPVRFSGNVGKALAQRGFYCSSYTQAILVGDPVDQRPELSADLTVELVQPETHEIYARTLADGFEWDLAWREQAVQGELKRIQSASEDEDILRFLARIDGVPAGTAAMSFRDGVASLSAGAVLPAFRNRGVHQALIHQRLFAAHELSAELVTSGADFGSASFRNQQRFGLQLAFIECGWSKLESRHNEPRTK